jgi:hypothetical protein
MSSAPMTLEASNTGNLRNIFVTSLSAYLLCMAALFVPAEYVSLRHSQYTTRLIEQYPGMITMATLLIMLAVQWLLFLKSKTWRAWPGCAAGLYTMLYAAHKIGVLLTPESGSRLNTGGWEGSSLSPGPGLYLLVMAGLFLLLANLHFWRKSGKQVILR